MITYGFYNSKNGDRKYDAVQMSSIFDGIIRDGVFMSIGDHFNVTASGENMSVNVGPGRAWFNHTWTLNDAQHVVTIPQSDFLYSRIDAVVLEVNAGVTVRANSVKVVKGTPSVNPVKPAMTDTQDIHQYPLAYVTVGVAVDKIRQADVENAIGTGAAPFVTGILDTINIDTLIAQWKDQWKAFYETQTADIANTNNYWKNQWQTFYGEYTTDMTTTANNWKQQWAEYYADMDETIKGAFAMWTALWNEFYTSTTLEITSTADNWKQQWMDFYAEYSQKIIEKIEYWDNELETYFNGTVDMMNTTSDGWKKQWHDWYDSYTEANQAEWVTWSTNKKQEVEDWFDGVQDLLDPDTEATMASEMVNLQQRMDYLEQHLDTFLTDLQLNPAVKDDNGNDIVDSKGEVVRSELLFRMVV